MTAGSGRSPGEGNGYPPQYFCLENSMDRGAWWATVHGVATHKLDTTEQLTVTFSQAEMRNMFLETGSKDLVIKQQKTWLNCILCNRK